MRTTVHRVRRFTHVVTACVLILIFSVPSNLFAQSHVVTPAELQNELVKATQTRQQNLQTVNRFLSSPQAEKALRATQLDPAQVKTALTSLNDHELSQLAARSAKAQADFAAGRLTDRDLLLVLVGIAALILIIVAVR